MNKQFFRRVYLVLLLLIFFSACSQTAASTPPTPTNTQEPPKPTDTETIHPTETATEVPLEPTVSPNFTEYSSDDFFDSYEILSPNFSVQYPDNWDKSWLQDSGILALLVTSDELNEMWGTPQSSGIVVMIISTIEPVSLMGFAEEFVRGTMADDPIVTTADGQTQTKATYENEEYLQIIAQMEMENIPGSVFAVGRILIDKAEEYQTHLEEIIDSIVVKPPTGYTIPPVESIIPSGMIFVSSTDCTQDEWTYSYFRSFHRTDQYSTYTLTGSNGFEALRDMSWMEIGDTQASTVTVTIMGGYAPDYPYRTQYLGSDGSRATLVWNCQTGALLESSWVPASP